MGVRSTPGGCSAVNQTQTAGNSANYDNAYPLADFDFALHGTARQGTSMHGTARGYVYTLVRHPHGTVELVSVVRHYTLHVGTRSSPDTLDVSASILGS